MKVALDHGLSVGVEQFRNRHNKKTGTHTTSLNYHN